MRSKMKTRVDEMYHDGIKLNQALKEFERRYIEAAWIAAEETGV